VRASNRIEPVLLESLLPEYDFREFHKIVVRAPASHVFRAIKECTPRNLPIMRALMAIRLLPARLIGRRSPVSFGDRGLLDSFIAAGFLILAEQRDREIVIGRIGQFWKPIGGEFPRVTSRDAFSRFDSSGFVKAATNFLLEADQGGATVLSTETRIAATDAAARRKFGIYWALIQFGSGLIRREWLRAIKRRAIELSS
jgi:hypothetical protein